MGKMKELSIENHSYRRDIFKTIMGERVRYYPLEDKKIHFGRKRAPYKKRFARLERYFKRTFTGKL